MNTMNKTNTPYLNDDRASIGIGAMIVFIALILVAAVASTIIIKTAEELQQRAEATGDDTRDEISGKIQLIMAYVSGETGGGATTVDEITLVVQMAAGSDATLLEDIQWLIVCDDGAGAAEINNGAAETTGVGAAVNARCHSSSRTTPMQHGHQSDSPRPDVGACPPAWSGVCVEVPVTRQSTGTRALHAARVLLARSHLRMGR